MALIESNWSGHHPTYFKAFGSALLKNGCRVFGICPKPEEIWREFASGILDVWSNDVVRWTPKLYDVRPRRFSSLVNKFLADRWLCCRLRQYERSSGCRIDLVFFACLYELTTIPRNFPWKWSGLLLQCRSFRMPGTAVLYSTEFPRVEQLVSHSKMTSIATLDERAITYLTGLSGGKRAIAFPDFTDNSRPTERGVGEKLRKFASGRRVVGTLGHLQPSKGVITLARVALQSEIEDVVFAFVGNLMLGVFTNEEKSLLNVVANRSNVFAHFEQLPTEADFNAVVDACDILFAAYQNFPHSSNILGKAALFRKPVIVSSGYLMAERVQRFSLGEIVPENDSLATERAIRLILSDPRKWNSAEMPRWSAYLEEHSSSRLTEAFEEILSFVG